MPASEQPDTTRADPQLLARLIEMLGLAPDADAVITGIVTALRPGMALAAEQPDPARFIPIDAVKELLAGRSSQLVTMRESDAKAKVDGARPRRLHHASHA